MDDIFYHVLLHDRVKIEPKYLGKNYKDYILRKLKSNLEDKCTKHGFIKVNSITLYKVAPGVIEHVSLSGFTLFDVQFHCDLCNPMIGNIVRPTVVNMNRFGILADYNNILEVVIPKNSVSIIHDDAVDIDAIKIQDVITVEVVGKKFELNDKKISIVGRLVTNTKKSVRKMPAPIFHMPEIEELPGVAANGDEDVVDDGEEVEVEDEGEGEEEAADKSEDELASEADEEEDVEDDEDGKIGGNDFFDSDEDIEENDDIDVEEEDDGFLSDSGSYNGSDF